MCFKQSSIHEILQSQVTNCSAQPVIGLELVPPTKQHVHPGHWQRFNSNLNTKKSESNSCNSNKNWHNSKHSIDAIPNLLAKMWSNYPNMQTRDMSLILWLWEILASKRESWILLVSLVVHQDFPPRADSNTGMAWQPMKWITFCQCHEETYIYIYICIYIYI